jgi:uncharacterized protein (DUF488 family)
MRIFSIGYEKAAQSDLLKTLVEAGVELIADVRERPQSRRAGFSKRMLDASAAAHGIAYQHFRQLGTPPEGREAHRRHDLPTFWRIFEAQVQSPPAVEALAALIELARARRTSLLCYEADWHVCHRRRVCELLEPHGFEVHHLSVAPSFL